MFCTLARFEAAGLSNQVRVSVTASCAGREVRHALDAPASEQRITVVVPPTQPAHTRRLLYTSWARAMIIFFYFHFIVLRSHVARRFNSATFVYALPDLYVAMAIDVIGIWSLSDEIYQVRPR